MRGNSYNKEMVSGWNQHCFSGTAYTYFSIKCGGISDSPDLTTEHYQRENQSERVVIPDHC